jgi:hypothetical protein
MMTDRLWTPGDAPIAPTTRKAEGGSTFDDEVGTQEQKAAEYAKAVGELLSHLNQRPDHVVYVGSSKDREELREVFNWWNREGALSHNPNIRIDYGVPDGTIRVDEAR